MSEETSKTTFPSMDISFPSSQLIEVDPPLVRDTLPPL
jgi:hypothetical protein